jgi:hypothetical protein
MKAIGKEAQMKNTAIIILLTAITLSMLACGEKKTEQTPEMNQRQPQVQPQMQVQPQIQVQPQTKMQPSGSPEQANWNTVPLFPEMTPTDIRRMPSNQQYAFFDIQVFISEKDLKTILDFYKEEVPEDIWKFNEETKLDNGHQYRWEGQDGRSTLWVRVTEDRAQGKREIELIYGHKKQESHGD